MVTKCCGQTYCRKCIEKWLNGFTFLLIPGHNTFPNCRSLLNIAGLNPVKALAYIIAELPVKCRYRSDGCPEVIAFGRWSSHVKTCQYRLCKCGFRGSEDGHNCVQYLMAENDKLKKQLVKYCHVFDPLLTDFTGKFRRDLVSPSLSNYGRLLEYLELSYLKTNIINRMLPIIKINKNGDVFTISAGNNFGYIRSFKTAFQLGEEFVTFDETIGMINTIFTIEDNKLIQVSRCNGKVVNIVSELKDNVMTIKGSVGDVVFTDVYHKI